jgi:DNA polymerase I-like protein with 3'-5' exonuclease and polymerase domains
LLAIQYNIGAVALAGKLGVSEVEAQEMIDQHRALFRIYWAWAADWLNWALNHGLMWTNLDWRCAAGELELKERSIINWPTQSAGGDILRLSCIWADRHGVKLCAPVHDALLIEAPLDEIDHDVALVCDIMRRASRLVLGGYELRTDATIVRYPNHYSDPRGDEIWAHVTALLARLKGDVA